jgi:hypothetical protein
MLCSASNNVALGLCQPITEMSTRNLFEVGKARPARKADNLAAISETTVYVSHLDRPPRSVTGTVLFTRVTTN